jgi:hypothetical protein
MNVESANPKTFVVARDQPDRETTEDQGNFGEQLYKAEPVTDDQTLKSFDYAC